MRRNIYTGRQIINITSRYFFLKLLSIHTTIKKAIRNHFCLELSCWYKQIKGSPKICLNSSSAFNLLSNITTRIWPENLLHTC